MTKSNGSPRAASEATLKVAASVEQFDEIAPTTSAGPDFGHVRDIAPHESLWLHGVYEPFDDAYTDYWRAYAEHPRIRKDGVVAIACVEPGRWRLFNARSWRGLRDGVLHEEFATATEFPTHADALAAGLAAIDRHRAWGLTGHVTAYGWTPRPEPIDCSSCAGLHTRDDNAADKISTLVHGVVGGMTVEVVEDTNWTPAIVEMRTVSDGEMSAYITHDADVACAMAQALLDEAGEAA